MADSLSQIIAQLNSVYSPQVDLLKQQQASIPQQIADQQQGLNAQKDQAFGDITDQARRRGLGFSGIPLSEEAKYTASSYLPALAQLRQQGNDKATSLEQAILGLNQNQNTQAYQIQSDQYNRDFQQQQLDAQKAAAAAANSYSPSFGSAGGAPQPQQAAASTDPIQQAAYNDAYSRVSKQSDAQIVSDYKATLASANYGNPRDKAKVEIYQQLRPDLFLPIGAQYSRYFMAPTPQKQAQPQPTNNNALTRGTSTLTAGIRF